MSISTNDQAYVSKAGAARLLGLDVDAVDRMIRGGHLAAARSYPGVKYRYRRVDVLALKAKFETCKTENMSA